MKAADHPIFALDIGTRKVAGLVVEPHGRSLRVVAACVKEHPDRAMMDGQVHKVEAVAKVVSEIKQTLEKQLGITLTRAAVAAAGRALLTESAIQQRRLPNPAEINRADVLSLELAAAQTAHLALKAHGNKQHLHCVGFSSIRYTLDGEPMDDLVGQQGQEISTEILATFLPRQVVDALLAVLRRAGLSALSLTLEPIAAIEATIPPDLRRMNIALVDIGAGTSDIAITREGSVFAYAMVTQAGDEITERLCEQYLLDFSEAERIKRQLEAAGDSEISMTTILGQRIILPGSEILHTILPDVERLAHAIADTIIKLNGKAPRAVIMVGGGSRTPRLGPLVAAALQIEATRVGSRGPEMIADLENPTDFLKGIEGITPLGIALLALQQKGLRFVNAHLNGHTVQMLSLANQPTVFDAILASGQEIKQLYPRPGQAITYTLDGKFMTCPGTLGKSGLVRVNQTPATLDTAVMEGGQIEVVEAEHGQNARLLASAVSKTKAPYWCSVNGVNFDLHLILLNRGEPVAMDQAIPDRAELTWVANQTVESMIPELSTRPDREPGFSVTINGEKQKNNPGRGLRLQANGNPIALDYRPRPNDRIEWVFLEKPTIRLQELVQDLPEARVMTVMVNGQLKKLEVGGCRILVNGQLVGRDSLVPRDAEIVVEKFSDTPPILSRVLDGLDLKPLQQTGPIQLRVDGQKAAFTTPLREGCHVEITFG